MELIKSPIYMGEKRKKS